MQTPHLVVALFTTPPAALLTSPAALDSRLFTVEAPSSADASRRSVCEAEGAAAALLLLPAPAVLPLPPAW